MADSIPSLRRKLNDALAEIERLRRQLAVKPDPEVRKEYVYVDKPVPGPCRTEYVYVDKPVIEYVDNPEHIRMIEELQGRLRACQAISQSDS